MLSWTSKRRVEDLERRLTELEEATRGSTGAFSSLQVRLVELETPVRELQAEWEDMFEKFRNLYGRITKRIKREQEEQEEPAEVVAPTSPGIPADINPLAERLLRRSG